MGDKSFRILYLLTEPFGVGGVQSDIKALGPYFVRKGHEVLVACPMGDQVPFLEKAGVQHIPFSVHFRTPGEFRSQSRQLRDLIEANRPTVLAPQSIRSSWLCHSAAREFPLVRATTIHNIHTPFNSLYAGFLLNRCSHLVIFESDHEHRRLTRMGLSPSKACVVPSGIDTDTFFKTPRPGHFTECVPDPAPDTVIFGCVARLSEEKAHKDLLSAFAKVHTRYPASRLVLVGDGPLRDDLLGRTKALGLSAAVHFAGQRSNIPEYLNLFDVFVLASTRESLPRAARESMACGLPVIATKVGATREAVHHQSNGLLVPPGDPEALSEAMIRLVEEPELRRRMGEKSLSLIQKRFSQKIWLEENERIYLRAASLAGNPAGIGSLRNGGAPCS